MAKITQKPTTTKSAFPGLQKTRPVIKYAAKAPIKKPTTKKA